MEKIKIIKLKDYENEYVYYGSDCTYSIDELEDIIEEQLLDGIEPDKYATGYWTEVCGGLYIIDELQNSHYDEGYEGINHILNYKSEKLIEAQKLVDEWLKEEEQTRTCYIENPKEKIDISELIEEIREKIKKDLD